MNKENKTLNQRIHFNLDSFLINNLKVSIDGKKATGDYQFSNISDFFRSAVLDLKNNKNLDLSFISSYDINNNQERKRYAFRVTQEIKDIFDTFPDRERSEIAEKILGTYYREI